MQQEIIKAFETGLEKLRLEVVEFADDGTFWSVRKGINNSSGNLTLHLLGNLNHYIGAKLGGSRYVRNRPVEFSSGPQPRAEIIDRIDQTGAVVIAAIEGLSDEKLRSAYPNDEGDEKRSVEAELIRILTHFNYHLGQINYFRRLSSN